MKSQHSEAVRPTLSDIVLDAHSNITDTVSYAIHDSDNIKVECRIASPDSVEKPNLCIELGMQSLDMN